MPKHCAKNVYKQCTASGVIRVLLSTPPAACATIVHKAVEKLCVHTPSAHTHSPLFSTAIITPPPLLYWLFSPLSTLPITNPTTLIKERNY